MAPELEDAFGKIQTHNHALTTLIKDLTEHIHSTNRRLDEIVALLTPKEPSENGLSDLLSHLIMIVREQLTLAQKSSQLLISIDGRLPPSPNDTPKEPVPANGSHSP